MAYQQSFTIPLILTLLLAVQTKMATFCKSNASTAAAGQSAKFSQQAPLPHYRRATATRAPRKRSFVANMEKYVVARSTPVGESSLQLPEDFEKTRPARLLALQLHTCPCIAQWLEPWKPHSGCGSR